MAMLFVLACSPTRRIEDGEFLLDKSKINIDSKDIDPAEMKRYEKQNPNKRILGLRFHLFLYNLASPKKEKFPSSWLRKIGEEPVIWDPLLTKKTTDQFKKYLESKGYYNAIVQDTVFLKKKHAIIRYKATLNDPYRINSIKYDFEDQNLAPIILGDTLNRLINIGNSFDKEILQKERQRLEDMLKNAGYYKFAKEFIFFEAKPADKKNFINLLIIIKEDPSGTVDQITKVKRHRQYLINNIYIYPNYDLLYSNQELIKLPLDTVIFNRIFLIYAGKHRITPDAVMTPNMFIPSALYHLRDVKKTYDNYTFLGLFRTVNIYFKELKDQVVDTGEYKYINCFIELSPRKIQTYKFEVVGTNSAGDLGVRNNILYNNYNVFRGAENLQVKITGAIESVRHQYKGVSKNLNVLYESGIETSLTFPKFIVPFNAKSFIRKYNPKTTFNLSYNYQNRPEFVRTIANTSYGYQWKGNSFNRHYLKPVNFSYVWLPLGITEPTFQSEIQGTSLENSFKDHTILSASYQFEFTNQVIEKLNDFVYLRINLEAGGNLINGILQLTPSDNDSMFLGVPYFQFLKSDIDFRYYNQITPDNQIVYRVFIGVGCPFGNSNIMPFEKMYFSGGPYGIRAWRTLTLGPGSVPDTSSRSNYASNLGDIKIEANIEYRFKLFWKMEGALFLDAGNIWLIKDDPRRPRPGASFKWNKFYNDIAIGTGSGLRFDFSFFLIGIDYGFKLRDPAIQTGSKWIDANSSVNYRLKQRGTFQFVIGYPF
jgi:hypothetical protein